MPYCCKCGKENDVNSNYCIGCGNRLSSTDLPSEQPQQNEYSYSYIYLIAIAVFVIIGICFVVMKSSSNKRISDVTKSPYINSSLTLESYNTETNNKSTYIIGTVSTSQQRDLGIYIIVRFYDKDGAVLREGFDSSDALSAGEKWKFKILVPTEAEKYEIKEVSIVVPG